MSASSFPTDPQPPPRKRQRARKACLPCRQRKRKCDVQFPCSMCTTYGYQCQYPQDDGPSAPFAEKPGQASSPVTDRRVPVISPGKQSESEDVESQMSPSDRGILDPVKIRYMGLHSLMAFPRALGLDFQSANPPRLHSFAWNCGIRPEEEPEAHGNLRDLISREDFKTFSEVYFETCLPVFGIIDKKEFLKDVLQWWNAPTKSLAFDAVIAGVVVLGSFFSADLGHSREAEIARYAKHVLEDSSLTPNIDHVCAWILRTTYLRTITKPHRAWLASCTTLHVAEACGLHHEIDAVVLTNAGTPGTILKNQQGCEQARKIFWMAWHVNVMISYEYARSCIVLNSITCKLPQAVPGDATAHLIAISQLVPRDSDSSNGPDLKKTLPKLQQIPDEQLFVSMSKADLCMSLYRHHRLLKLPLDKEDVLQIIAIGNRAIEAAYALAQEKTYWWNVLCTTFQYVCCLLAIDTAESLSNVSSAIATLENITRQLGTHVATEALNTAQVLLRDSMKKKRHEVALLEAADAGDNMAEFENVDVDWDTLLDPWYMTNFPVMAQDLPMLGESIGGTMPSNFNTL
ncbi:uncharacterized protein LY89DRAFT_713093 [Mollisia scopiformis]|uniref:Zn(2)-C6 fungal-type domain-containing protein n=1 Tax=Mollisia scopiformis TaxID=149040 RepID=A0A194XWS2_MOLSC|nr:uncharacterized protein LY89DRAFT_713093 [Mollisia scopiformis]KUJ24187.1 hypothetical protein LY89DRAFT_713093 [Mollisia scopiformis]